MKLFGFEFQRIKEPYERNEATSNASISFVEKNSEDTAALVSGSASYGTYVDLQGVIKTEAELITKYRDMVVQPEVDNAVDEIVNESISTDEDYVVKIDLDDVPLDEQGREIIEQEFHNIIQLLDFKFHAYNIYKRWYVDGRLYYDTVIDNNHPEEGIKELRYIDPRKIREIKEIIPRKLGSNENIQNTVDVSSIKNEYFLYNERGFGGTNKNNMPTQGNGSAGIRLAKDKILHVPSGLTDVNGTMGIGYLHKAIKILNQLRTIEDSLIIYRLARAPERRVWYVDVGDLPKAKAEQYVRDVMVSQKNRLIYDADTGNIRDDRKFMCFSLETKIPLLDGRTLTIQEIINEYESGKENWVYSCDPITGKFIPGPVSWAGITKKNSEAVKITFDNGKTLICTPDHKFPTWNNGLVEAKNLVGESIIPGYRKKSSLYEGGKEYEQIFKNDTQKWEFVHREVSRWKNENNLREEMIYDEKYINNKKQTIHHKNCNNLDNSPNNLVMMNKDDHLKYHAEQARYNFKPNKSEDFTPEWKLKLSEKAKLRIPVSKTWKIKTPNDEELIITNLNDFCRKKDLNRSNIKSKSGSKGYHAEILRNHKAISVEFLEEKMDMACLTIDLEETFHSHHTYLLDVGVYTKNTMLEDYWLPKRADGSGTHVDTLQGGSTLGQLEDVLYFQKQLYNALNVPVARLNPDAPFMLGRTNEVSRDEIKFDKFITRLRQQFSLLFTKALEKQLVLKGFFTIEEWEQISKEVKYEFARDNHFAELKDSEMLAGRLQTLEMIMPFIGSYYSHKWVRRNILRQTDEDIEKMTMEISEEMADPLYQMAAQQQNGGEDGGGQEQPQESGGESGGGGESANSAKYKQEEKLDKAQHIIQALKDVKGKTPEEISKLRSAAQVVAKAGGSKK